MSRIFKPFPVIALLIFCFGVGSGSAYSGDKTETAIETAEQTTVDGQVLTESKNTVSSPRQLQKAKLKPEPTVPPNPWLGYENVCETFTVYQSMKPTKKGTYPVRYKRNRYKRKRSDQKRTRQVIRLVAKEMGANPDFVEMLAHHESSYNPEAIHILNPDLDANRRAWQKFTYSRTKELTIEAEMAKTSKQDRRYYSLAKRQLSRVQLYKSNPFWDAKQRYEYVYPSREGTDGSVFPEERVEEWASVWSYGYGLYGMNAILYTHVWDKQAPPWILCGDDGVVATVTAIWALREQQDDCSYLTGEDPEKYGTDGGSYRGVIRRYARGQCSSKRLGKAWRRLMDDRNDKIDWDATAQLGDKWPRHDNEATQGQARVQEENGKRIRSDREALLAHMREKVEAAGLARETPLERKRPGTEATVAMKTPVSTVAVN